MTVAYSSRLLLPLVCLFSFLCLSAPVRAASEPIQTFGYSQIVNGVVSPDGQYTAAANNLDFVVVWDNRTGNLAAILDDMGGISGSGRSAIQSGFSKKWLWLCTSSATP